MKSIIFALLVTLSSGIAMASNSPVLVSQWGGVGSTSSLNMFVDESETKIEFGCSGIIINHDVEVTDNTFQTWGIEKFGSKLMRGNSAAPGHRVLVSGIINGDTMSLSVVRIQKENGQEVAVNSNYTLQKGVKANFMVCF